VISLLITVWLLAQTIADHRAEAERERETMLVTLRKAQRFESIGRLAGSVAHELSSPLACISSNIECVTAQLQPLLPTASDQSLSAVLNTLEDAMRNVDRMRRVLYDLRRYGDAKESPLAPLPIKEIVQSTVNLVTVYVRDRARIVTELGDTDSVLGSRSRLLRAFVNLVLHLADTLSTGFDRQNIIYIRTRMQKPTVIIEIGSIIALAKDAVERPLLPIPNNGLETGPTVFGTGIEASAAIVSSMGGTLATECAAGEICRFVMRLPAGKGDSPKV
jgi:C4-dicarboxylate-specific signal transduction histidine kinase